MTSLEKQVKNSRSETVIADYNQELIDFDIRREFLHLYYRHTPRGKMMLKRLREEMKRDHEHFMIFGDAPLNLIEKYYNLFCPKEHEEVGLA